jgi:serine/tyrosine/threonine adenylyltransferase
MTIQLPFDNSYARLPERFFARVRPSVAVSPRLVKLNRPLALELGLDPDWLASPPGLGMLSGEEVPAGADPIATAYAGHQFGQFVPQLGDGRAILLGEVVDRQGRRRDIQLKGSGRTPFSRQGDGRAALGPVLREYVVSEAMAALGIPTTRALAAVTTGDTVVRDAILPGAVLTRIASSHIRVGTFQFFAARGDLDGLRALADHAIERHYPAVADTGRPYLALLDAVVLAQADLVAQWMLVGFIHGVMNTDNTSIAGETIDYGPCAFMDAYHPRAVFSSIDVGGRYAYGNQPGIAQWNLARFAETLLHLIDPDTDKAIARAQDVLALFPQRFEHTFHAGLKRKVGLPGDEPDDIQLAADLLRIMADNGADFTLTFRSLCDAVVGIETEEPVRRLLVDREAADAWLERWRARLRLEPGGAADRRAAMRRVNPAFIPRNHRVEALIAAAVDHDDFGPFEALLDVLSRPFDDQPNREHFADPPLPDERVLQTFCGT